VSARPISVGPGSRYCGHDQSHRCGVERDDVHRQEPLDQRGDNETLEVGKTITISPAIDRAEDRRGDDHHEEDGDIYDEGKQITIKASGDASSRDKKSFKIEVGMRLRPRENQRGRVQGAKRSRA